MTSKARVDANVMLGQELPKPMIKKFKRRKAYSRFKDSTWASDLAEMRSLSSLTVVLNIYCM